MVKKTSVPTFVPYGRTGKLKALVVFTLQERPDGLFDIFSSEKDLCLGKNVPEIIDMPEGKRVKAQFDESKSAYIIQDI